MVAEEKKASKKKISEKKNTSSQKNVKASQESVKKSSSVKPKKDAPKTPQVAKSETVAKKSKNSGNVIEISQKNQKDGKKIVTKTSYKGPTMSLVQYRSAIRRNGKQGLILKGLGVRKIGNVVVVPDTPEFRGMVNKISHLVKIVENV